MKTLKVALMIAVIVASSITSNVNAQDKKVKFVKSTIKELLESANISEAGVVDIYFKVSDNKIKVLSIESENPELSKKIKSYLEANKIKHNQLGYYKMSLKLNGGSRERYVDYSKKITNEKS